MCLAHVLHVAQEMLGELFPKGSYCQTNLTNLLGWARIFGSYYLTWEVLGVSNTTTPWNNLIKSINVDIELWNKT